jgi:hypothetical protein
MSEDAELGGDASAPAEAAMAAADDVDAPHPVTAVRAVTTEPVTADRAARTVEVVWSTGTRGQNYVPGLGEILEELGSAPVSAFAAALAVLVADPHLGTEALYRPGGADPAVSVRVIRDRSAAEAQGFGTTLRAGAELLHLRVADAPGLAKGDTFAIGAEVLMVQGTPRRDALGLMWTAECSLTWPRHWRPRSQGCWPRSTASLARP